MEKFLALVVMYASLCGCEALVEAQRTNETHAQAQREAFQRNWDAMAHEQRMQYQLALQQLAVQQLAFKRQQAEQQRQTQLLQSIQLQPVPVQRSIGCTSNQSGSTYPMSPASVWGLAVRL